MPINVTLNNLPLKKANIVTKNSIPILILMLTVRTPNSSVLCVVNTKSVLNSLKSELDASNNVEELENLPVIGFGYPKLTLSKSEYTD